MALITNIKYRGNIIATLGEGETKTLATSLKICDSDIVVEVVDNLITFTVDGTSYNAEEGQTWMQWVLTDYNTDHFYLEEDTNTLFTADDKEILYNGNGISGTYVIIANGVYTIAPSGVVLSAGTYVAVDIPDIEEWSWNEVDLTFASNGTNYTGLIYGFATDAEFDIIRYTYNSGGSFTRVYTDGTWLNTAYKTITTSTDQTVTEEFATWFNANYTKQVEDELAGTWVFNSNSVVFTETFNSVCNVVINGVQYQQLGIEQFAYSSSSGFVYAYYTPSGNYDTLYAYEPDMHEDTRRWVSSSYKTWEITSNLADVTNGDALLTWLKANATKQ